MVCGSAWPSRISIWSAHGQNTAETGRVESEGPAAAQRYRDAVPQLTSRANWARLYGIDESTSR